jgi:hypothetical protein
MAHTFRVDDVETVRAPLAGIEIEPAVAEALGVELIHLSHRTTLIDEARDLHPLLQAVHVAFAEHRPLSLSPDHIWLIIAQGFAIHVDQHAEELRSRFVRHDGRAEVAVSVEELPQTSAAWAAAITQFGKGIEQHVGTGVHRLLSCAFSTTTERERVAAEVVMMSAFRRYFDFVMRCVCGIPEVTLEGAPADWAEIRRRADVLAEYDLAWWMDALRPVLDELVNTARGKVDRDFWQCLYKPKDAYGGELATGWIMRFFPYLQHNAGPPVRNPAVNEAPSSSGRARWISRGISPRSAPGAFSRATLTLEAGATPRRISVFGGFAGVQQLAGGALRPEIAWAVGALPRMATLIDRIVAEHEPRPLGERAEERRSPDLPAELIELYDRCDGAVLFGRWNLARKAELRMLVGSTSEGFLGLDPRNAPRRGYTPSETIPVLPICTLEDDPRFFGLYHGDRFVVVLCDPRHAQDLEDIVVVADDVATFIERIFEHQGALWFEDLRGPTLYSRLGPYHHYLRRALTVGPHAPPTDLDRREKERLVMCLYRHEVTEEQRAFWWEALRGATGTKWTFDALFGERRSDKKAARIDVLRALGLR